MDVTLLRYLCGIPTDAVPGIVGLTPAITHTLDQLRPDPDSQE
ncbi:hypothetical protein [Streptomyces sp. NPDC018584]